MPPHFNNEALDDPLLFDGSPSFVGGMNSLVEPRLLEQFQYADAENMDIDRSGRIITRPGVAALGTAPQTADIRGAFWYNWTGNDVILQVSNSLLYKWGGSGWTNVTGFAPTETTDIEFCSLNGTVLMFDGVQAHSWDGVAAGTTSTAAITNFPNDAKYCCVQGGRVWAAGGPTLDRDAITFSKVLDPGPNPPGSGSWPAVSSFSVGGGEGDGINGLIPWQQWYVVVLKRNALFAVNADPSIPAYTVAPTSQNWSVETISNTVGCVSGRSAAQVGDDIFFLSSDGVRTISRVIDEKHIGLSLPISDPIKPIIDRINWTSADKACAKFYRNRYFLSIPVDSSTNNNYTIVYNLLTRSWTGYWTGWLPTVWVISEFSNIEKLIYGDISGKMLEWQGWKTEADLAAGDYLDQGGAYVSSFTTKGYIFGDLVGPKTGYSYDIEFFQSEADVHTHVILDQSGETRDFALVTDRVDLVLPFFIPVLLPLSGSFRISRDLSSHGPFHTMQLKVEADSGKLSAQGVAVTAFSDTINEDIN